MKSFYSASSFSMNKVSDKYFLMKYFVSCINIRKSDHLVYKQKLLLPECRKTRRPAWIIFVTSSKVTNPSLSQSYMLNHQFILSSKDPFEDLANPIKNSLKSSSPLSFMSNVLWNTTRHLFECLNHNITCSNFRS